MGGILILNCKYRNHKEFSVQFRLLALDQQYYLVIYHKEFSVQFRLLELDQKYETITHQ